LLKNVVDRPGARRSAADNSRQYQFQPAEKVQERILPIVLIQQQHVTT
jgi:hypothetical protein